MSAITGRLAEIEGAVAQIEGRIGAIERDVAGLVNGLSANDVAEKLAEFEGVWEVMIPLEQITIIHSLIEAIDCSASGSVAIHLKTLNSVQRSD